MPDTQISEEMVRIALRAYVQTPAKEVAQEAMRAALEAALSGHVVVPREPTQAMLDAGYYPAIQRRGAKSVWQCMIQAAHPCKR